MHVNVFDKNKNTKILKIDIGILNSNKDLNQFIKTLLCREITKIYLYENELNLNEVKSLASIGITEDFDCKVKVGNFI